MYTNDSKTAAYENTHRLIMKYMADFTNTSTPPKVKKGWYALVTRDTGDVWLAESPSFSAVMQRFRSGSMANMPVAIDEAVKAGQKLDLWFCTKPEINVEQLREELDQRDQLLQRTAPRKSSNGRVFVIRHDKSADYFLTKTRNNNTTEYEVLTKFMYYIGKIEHSHHFRSNKLLQSFVTEQAEDILKCRGFTITEVAEFKSIDEAIEIMENFTIDSPMGRCLNQSFTRH